MWQKLQEGVDMLFFSGREEGNANIRKDRRLVKTKCRSVLRHGKRAYRYLSGSTVVEAALVLPLYIYFSVLVTQLILLPGIRLRVRQALYEDARILAESAYACQKAGEHLGDFSLDEEDDETAEAVYELNTAAAKALLVSRLGADYGRKHGIAGGTAGILLLDSEIAENDNDIILRAVYELKLPFYDIFHQSITVRETVMTSAWLGESGEKEDEEDEDEEERVYITEQGEVYHRDRNCTYIEVTLQETEPDDVAGRRNASGHKYYPCEVCAAGSGQQTGQKLFITRYGERYHTRADCPAIERHVREIPLSEAGSRRPCSKCGSEDG